MASLYVYLKKFSWAYYNHQWKFSNEVGVRGNAYLVLRLALKNKRK